MKITYIILIVCLLGFSTITAKRLRKQNGDSCQCTLSTAGEKVKKDLAQNVSDRCHNEIKNMLCFHISLHGNMKALNAYIQCMDQKNNLSYNQKQKNEVYESMRCHEQCMISLQHGYLDQCH